MKIFIKNKNLQKLINILTALVLAFAFYPRIASATVVTALSDTMTRLKVNTLSSHDILFTLSGSNTFAAGETVTIDFDEDGTEFTVAGAASVAGDFDFSTGATERVIYNVGSSTDCTGSVGVNDISVGINDTTGLVTFLACPSFTASAVGAIVNIEYGTAAGGTNRVTNPNPGTPPVTYIIDIAGTFGDDAGKVAAVIIADDQIPVTASVDPTISFTVVNTTLALGTLSSSSISTTGYNNITVGTNGSGGYTISIKDNGSGSNPGLWNSPASKLIASADATPLSAGTEGYGGQCNKVSGDGSCTFTGTGDNVDGFLLTDQTFASYGSKPTGTDTFQVRVKAAIASATDAGSYNDTLTLIGTGNF